MFQRLLFAALVGCASTTLQAAERPPEFDALPAATVATACTVQMSRWAFDVRADKSSHPADKANAIRSLLELHQVWIRLSTRDKSEARRFAEETFAQDAKSRAAYNAYCMEEGLKMFRALSNEGKNSIRSQALDLMDDLFK